ncbi:MAG: methyltransferase domain-containing protein [Patescibacteria group bacterium]
MSWFSYIFPQTIFRASSTYNRDIRINEERGKLKLLANGSRQSGAYIEQLWRRAFKAFGIIPNSPVRSILVLGVAGGTVIHLLRDRYLRSRIVGVDIDPVMIDIGKRYFGLDAIPSLRIVQGDAKQFVHRTTDRFDLIIVDLFLGREIPAFVRSPIFLRRLRHILNSGGTVVINFLRELEYGMKSDKLMKILQKIFPTVSDFGMYHNRFFAAT